MTNLWLAAVALLVLALLFVVPPLLRSPAASSTKGPSQSSQVDDMKGGS